MLNIIVISIDNTALMLQICKQFQNVRYIFISRPAIFVHHYCFLLVNSILDTTLHKYTPTFIPCTFFSIFLRTDIN
jgi:hypothetical protein